ncbi:DMT family transporter [Paenisporosarcina indica]|uniref:DMT family transporter n=1 Tax=Paenisporosarcina indica TaxID=650093 RepID=UPI00094F8FBE|nr:DMT family transporter [Paenisporosarcina indica]
MKGIIFAILGGAFITLQSVANARISLDIGTWQTATITQLTGFIAAFLILLVIKDRNFKNLRQVQPLYLIGGTFGAIVVFSSIMAIQQIGVTLTVAVLLIAQLFLTFIIDRKGWFGMDKQNMSLSQILGITMMVVGVVILSL